MELAGLAISFSFGVNFTNPEVSCINDWCWIVILLVPTVFIEDWESPLEGGFTPAYTFSLLYIAAEGILVLLIMFKLGLFLLSNYTGLSSIGLIIMSLCWTIFLSYIRVCVWDSCFFASFSSSLILVSFIWMLSLSAETISIAFLTFKVVVSSCITCSYCWSEIPKILMTLG